MDTWELAAFILQP